MDPALYPDDPQGVGPIDARSTVPSLTPKDLLLAARLEPDQVAALLAPYRFNDVGKADANLQHIADEPRVRHLLADVIEELLDCLGRSPDPDQALTYFERFSKASYNKAHLFSYLKASPYTLWLLAKLLASSPFLSEILIRNPPYLYWIASPGILDNRRTKVALARELSTVLRTLKTREGRLRTLSVFKRKELLRIGVSDLLGRSSVAQTTAALSALAEVILQQVYELCDQSLQREFGPPMRTTRTRAAFTVLGMGKLGGEELNFSSDVDLIYLYDSADGNTAGQPAGGPATRISNREYFQRLAQAITASLTEVTNEGYLYRTDLRLRPEGNFGAIASDVDEALRYYAKRGATWERLALLKAWPVAGNAQLGRRFLSRVTPFIYRQPFAFEQMAEVRAIKETIDKKMRAKDEWERNVKLGVGGIREIEFIVQAIQTFFGGKLPALRQRNTLKAIEGLRRQRLFDADACRQLTEAYQFLRNVEHRLQMVHELQTHSLPADRDELRVCALRLDYRDLPAASATDQLLAEYRGHTGRVNHAFRSLFDSPRESPVIKAALRKGSRPSPKRAAKNR
jgi:glutamate-ammonia-ligase adenylyltransferase